MTLPPKESVFSATPPTKPGWYWTRYRYTEQSDWEKPYPVCVEQGESGLGVMNHDMHEFHHLREHWSAQWDPTPILGPGELQKVVREAYFEGWYEGRDVARNRGYDEEIEEVWEQSQVKKRLG